MFGFWWGNLFERDCVRYRQMLVFGFGDDVDALVSTAIANRSGHGNLFAILPADQLRIACGCLCVAIADPNIQSP